VQGFLAGSLAGVSFEDRMPQQIAPRRPHQHGIAPSADPEGKTVAGEPRTKAALTHRSSGLDERLALEQLGEDLVILDDSGAGETGVDQVVRVRI
jgi:hypothetical protein